MSRELQSRVQKLGGCDTALHMILHHIAYTHLLAHTMGSQVNCVVKLRVSCVGLHKGLQEDPSPSSALSSTWCVAYIQ